MNTDDKLHFLATLFAARAKARDYFDECDSTAEDLAATAINDYYNAAIVNEIKKLACSFNSPPSGGS